MAAALFSHSCVVLFTVVLPGADAQVQPAANSYFSADTPAESVFYYKPGDTFVFPPPGIVVEVHDPDLNGTIDGNVMPLQAQAASANPVLENYAYTSGPIASISRGAYVGQSWFSPGRPNSFRSPSDIENDPFQEVKNRWFCPEYGPYSRALEPGTLEGCDQEHWKDIPFTASDVQFTQMTDLLGNRLTNRTSFQYTFSLDASLVDDLDVPNPHRTICIQARGWSQPFDQDYIRCWSIIIDLRPRAATCTDMEIDESTCGKLGLPLFQRVEGSPLSLLPKDIVRVAVGQTMKTHIYFEDLNRDDSLNCSSCDDIVINVMSNPGLPNGAHLDTTKGRNIYDASDNAPSRLVRYKDQASDTPRGYYVYSRALTFTPSLADARPVNALEIQLHPEKEGNGVLYQICFQASTTMRTSGEMVHSAEFCGFIQVVLPMPQLLSSIQLRPPTTDEEGLPFHDATPQTSGTPAPMYEVTVRCPYEWEISTTDVQNDQSFTSIFSTDMNAGYARGFYQSTVKSDPNNPIPAQATITHLSSDDFQDGQVTKRVDKQVLAWTPERGMEGRTFKFCLLVTDASINSNAQKKCTQLMVKKCQVCTEIGDTLHSVAMDYRTDWLQLWGANPMVSAPNRLEQYSMLNLGPIFTTNRDESMSILAARFSMTQEDLAAVNPDLRQSKYINSSTDVCIIPRICDGLSETML